MTILTALRKLHQLNRSEVEHCIQRINQQLKDYERTCANYDPYRMLRFGVRYTRRLEAQRQQFIDRLEQLK